MILLAHQYSGMPLQLNHAGLGEAAAAAVQNGLLPLLAFGLQVPGFAGAAPMCCGPAPSALPPVSALRYPPLTPPPASGAYWRAALQRRPGSIASALPEQGTAPRRGPLRGGTPGG